MVVEKVVDLEVAEEAEVVEEAEAEEDLAVVEAEAVVEEAEDLVVVEEAEAEDLVVVVAKVTIEHLKLHFKLLILVVLLNLKVEEKFFDYVIFCFNDFLYHKFNLKLN